MSRTTIQKVKCIICGTTRKELIIEKDVKPELQEIFNEVPHPICKRCFRFYRYTGELRNARDKELGAIKKTRRIIRASFPYFHEKNIKIDMKDYEKWMYQKFLKS